ANSEVKRRSADGSVGSPHVRVGNCQASNKKNPVPKGAGFFAFISILAFLLIPYPANGMCDPCRNVIYNKIITFHLRGY
ncbi:hypothetical protein, partial [Enterobacter roggenkampii]|uniref:hypothetical protein n=11 Tax=Enterobacteriaceae TaxID=543 RepID=UPI001C95A388